uniref:(northern house mosquito) hypothetical protein n=1 Tax=Culex pipiens TaxID=7175 RepID=A0A8D8MMC9_CULPI
MLRISCSLVLFCSQADTLASGFVSVLSKVTSSSRTESSNRARSSSFCEKYSSSCSANFSRTFRRSSRRWILKRRCCDFIDDPQPDDALLTSNVWLELFLQSSPVWLIPFSGVWVKSL